MKVSEAIGKLEIGDTVWVKLKADGFDDIGAPLKVASSVDYDYMWIHENDEISLTEPQGDKVEAHLAEHWNEDIGDVLWWNFPVEEPPYCGTPLDERFPKYKTHFSVIDMPNEIEQPKQWVVKLPNNYYFSSWVSLYSLEADGAAYKFYDDVFVFDDRAKAEAVATLVEGSVEEID